MFSGQFSSRVTGIMSIEDWIACSTAEALPIAFARHLEAVSAVWQISQLPLHLGSKARTAKV
jgi:hypothetical protein